MAQHISGRDFNKKVIESERPVLVDFYADWCGPCQMMAPTIEELARELKGKAEIYKVDVDKESDLANEYQVMSIPTILIFKNGKTANQFTGVTKKEELVKALGL
jgi:thioredoxin 1